MRVEYSANNSGGSWWLKDQHWLALEAAGWTVEWGGRYFCKSEFGFHRKPQCAPEPCSSSRECSGHRAYASFDEAAAAGARSIGAIATEAYKDFETLKDAILEWEHVTGLEATDDGCSCCGPPHAFRYGTRGEEKYGYACGEEICAILYPNAPGSLREALAERERRAI
jgi:hypothetical protein